MTALQMVDILNCHTSHLRLSATEPFNAWTAEERRKKFVFPRHVREQQDSYQDHIGKQSAFYVPSNLAMVWD